MESEEGAALGLGVCALLGFGWLASKRARGCAMSLPPRPLQGSIRLVVPAAWIALLLIMSQSGLSAITRLLAPYYVLLIVPILRSAGQETFVRSRAWRAGALAVFALGAVLLVLNPARPLWPATTVFRALGGENASHPLVRRAWTVYSTYQNRPRAFDPVLRVLPSDANPLGFITFDDPETSLWRPFGARRIVHVRRSDTAQSLRERGIRYVLAAEERLRTNFQEMPPQLQARLDAEVITQVSLRLLARREPESWYLLRVRETASPASAGDSQSRQTRP
jgi:hypothetical protein